MTRLCDNVNYLFCVGKPVPQQSQSPAVNSTKLTLSSSSNGLVTLSSSTSSSFSPLSSLSSITNAAVSSSSLFIGSRESPVPVPTTTAMGTVPTLQSFASSSIPVVQSASQGFLPMSSSGQQQQQQQLSVPFKFSQQPNDQQGKQGLQLSPLDNDGQRLYPQMSNGPQVIFEIKSQVQEVLLDYVLNLILVAHFIHIHCN